LYKALVEKSSPNRALDYRKLEYWARLQSSRCHMSNYPDRSGREDYLRVNAVRKSGSPSILSLRGKGEKDGSHMSL
jgi:hypothetical protein